MECHNSNTKIGMLFRSFPPLFSQATLTPLTTELILQIYRRSFNLSNKLNVIMDIYVIHIQNIYNYTKVNIMSNFLDICTFEEYWTLLITNVYTVPGFAWPLRGRRHFLWRGGKGEVGGKGGA